MNKAATPRNLVNPLLFSKMDRKPILIVNFGVGGGGLNLAVAQYCKAMRNMTPYSLKGRRLEC